VSRAATARAEIAAAVRSARATAGMTRYDVAARACVGYSAVARIESGNHLPRPALTERVATAIGVDPRQWLAIVEPGHAEFAESSASRFRGFNHERTVAAIRAAHIARVDTARSRVTAERVALGLTGTALAERADVSKSDVAALETGLKAPREADSGEWRSIAVAVAEALGSTPAELWPEHAPKVPRLPRPESPARPDDLYLTAETAARITAAVAALPARHAYVIACRFGLGDNEAQTLLEVGDGLGFSRERARQIEHAALAALAKTLGDLRP
jgi:transcriptional regulator with XRE-family HTH domain